MKRLFFDTETTGLPKDYSQPAENFNAWPRMVQLGFIFQEDGKEPVKHGVLIKPEGFVIPPEATALHGITQEMAEEDGIEIDHALKAFWNALGQADVLIGHNVSFDDKIVGSEFTRRFGVNHLKDKKKICTMLSSTNYCKIPQSSGRGWKWPKLTQLYNILFGRDFEGAHDALNDVTATMECYFELVKLGVIKEDQPVNLPVKKEEKPMNDSLKIVELRGENVKRLKAVKFRPNDGVTIISGANGEGKTSTIDLIWLALKGAEASKQNPEIIRKGEKSGFTELDLGEYVVTRKFTESGTTLEVKNKDGAKFPSPQAMLDKLINSISLDPLAFLGYDSDKQRKLMLSMTDLTAALSKKDLEIQNVYNDRTFVNRELEKETLALKALEEIELPDDILENRVRVDISAANEELKKAYKNNSDFSVVESQFNAAKDKVAELTALLKDAQDNFELLGEQFVELSVVDVSELSKTIKEGEERNKHIDTLEKYEKQSELCETLHNKSSELTESLESLRAARLDAIKRAKYPLPGLGISEDGITYQDVPFVQLSSAEKLKVSIAMAMALNPRLKVIRITDGSLLDSKSMAIIDEMATENGYQVLIERVDETGKVGIVIEDGEISVNNYELPQETGISKEFSSSPAVPKQTIKRSKK